MAREIPDKLKNRKMTPNRTHEQMEDLRIAQVNNETEKMPANKARSIPDEYFRKEYENYKINEYDADSYHVAMEARLFNQQTGQKISRSRVQVFDPQTFKRLVDSNGFHGHVTYVLHDPTLASVKAEPIKGLDTKTGKVIGNPGEPVGSTNPGITPAGPAANTGNEAENSGNNSEENGNNSGTLENTDTNSGGATTKDADIGTGPGPNDPNNTDAESLNDADARALYMDLSGKSPDGRWSRKKLNEEIAELQGKV
jgi:hypothetical protein